MLQQNTCHVGNIKTAIVFIAVLFGTACVFFSYYQTISSTNAKYQALFLKEKKEITESVQQFYQYLTLTETRLLPSLQDKERISRILSERIEGIMDNNFPTIISMAFIPTTQPHITYTRFGKTMLKDKIQPEDKGDGVIYLGEGKFKIQKTFYDKSKKAFGILQSTFSIERFLYRNFTEEEMSIVPEQEQNLKEGQLSFQVMEIPYVFVYTPPTLSFLQFIFIFKTQIIVAFVFGFIVLLSGITIGAFLRQKILLRQHLINHRLKEKLKAFKEEKINQGNQLAAYQHLAKLNEQSKQAIYSLFTNLQDRYRKMAAQAHGINEITSKMILQEAGNEKLMKDVHGISQESNTILRRLVSGFPMREIEEPIDIFQSLEKLKTIFLPEMTKLSVALEIKGKIKTPPRFDRTIIEIVLHNIFYMIVDRLSKNSTFKIEVRGENPIQIIFYDDGYDVGEKIHIVDNNPKPENVLCLDKNKLKELVGCLGWDISFQGEEDFLNSVTLTIPAVLDEQMLPSNVVNLFNFKPYAE